MFLAAHVSKLGVVRLQGRLDPQTEQRLLRLYAAAVGHLRQFEVGRRDACQGSRLIVNLERTATPVVEGGTQCYQ